MNSQTREDISYFLIFMIGMISMIMYASGNPAPIIPQEVPQVELDSIEIETVSIDRTTIYNAVISQCDHDPFTTADGSYIDTNKLREGKLHWVALSQDLVDNAYRAGLHKGLFKGKFKFGDSIHVESKKWPTMNGVYVVHDVMNSRYRKSMDFLMPLNSPYKFSFSDDFKISKI